MTHLENLARKSIEEPIPTKGARTLRVGAVQTPAAESVSRGLERATPLVRRAAGEGAALVLLPELMAVRYVFTDEMWASAEPGHGTTVEWLKDSALALRIWLGTSFLEAAGCARKRYCQSLPMPAGRRRC